MTFFNKLRTSPELDASRRTTGPARGPAAPVNRVASLGAPPGPALAGGTARFSNGLKDFLWHLEGIGHANLVDLGPARQTTINFFIERGFKIYTEDLLMTWKKFLDAEELRLRELGPKAEGTDITPASYATRFMETTLNYPPDTIDAVLAWDLLDYLDAELLSELVGRLTVLVREGGVVLAMFHARKPEGFHRYRVLDAQNLELIPAPCPFAPQRVLQNREITNLFRRFRTSKFFVGRDQLREGLFVK